MLCTHTPFDIPHAAPGTAASARTQALDSIQSIVETLQSVELLSCLGEDQFNRLIESFEMVDYFPNVSASMEFCRRAGPALDRSVMSRTHCH